jgi:predicted ATPase
MRLSPSGDNLLSILKTMANSKSAITKNNYHEIISMMRQIIPNLTRIQVKNIGGLLWPLFDVKEVDGKVHQFNVSQISDGALRILGILVALYQPNPPDVVALEEPEQNVHPGFLGLIADSFRDFSNRAQLIITTHSPNLIDYFDIDNIYIAEFVDGQTTVGRVARDQREAVKEKLLTAGELMSAQGLLVDKQ